MLIQCSTLHVQLFLGDFVCEYTGELISGVEADKREDDTYLFEIIVRFWMINVLSNLFH